MSEQERANLLRIHDALAPMHENLSQTIRWCVAQMHFLIFTRGMLAELVAAIQGLQRSSLSDAAARAEEPITKPSRVGRRVGLSSNAPLRFLANRPSGRARAGEAGEAGMARFITPFPSLHLLPVRGGVQA
jgi:hypothetical protein